VDAKHLFEILVRENSRMLTAYIRATQFDASQVDDVWQETMLVAWRRIDDFDLTRPFGPWLRGIAQKIILSKYSTLNSQQVVTDAESLEYLSERFDSFRNLAGDTLDEKLEALRACIASLPDHERECIELRYHQELKPTDLSHHLNLALETVKKRLVRAKQRLIECIERKIGLASTQEATL
jgi:RNA polymerase sigma factor (sigma-70 family)